MVCEGPLEPLAVGGAKASVFRAPDDQRWPVGDVREIFLHLAQIVARRDDLAREDHGRFAAVRPAKRP